MKQYLGVGLGMLAGTVIGAAAVTGLHAQAKPPVYAITEIEVTNPEAFGKEFAPLAQASIKAAGGRQLGIGGVGGAGANPITTLEGTPPKGRIVIQVWDSLDQLKAWFTSDAYTNARKIGEKYATFRRYAFEGKSN